MIYAREDAPGTGELLATGFVPFDAEMRETKNGRPYIRFKLNAQRKKIETIKEDGSTAISWENKTVECIVYPGSEIYAIASTIKAKQSAFVAGRWTIYETIHNGATVKHIQVECDFVSKTSKTESLSASLPPKAVENIPSSFKVVEEDRLPF